MTGFGEGSWDLVGRSRISVNSRGYWNPRTSMFFSGTLRMNDL